MPLPTKPLEGLHNSLDEGGLGPVQPGEGRDWGLLQGHKFLHLRAFSFEIKTHKKILLLTQPRRPALHLEEVVSQLRLGLGGQELVQAGDPVARHCVQAVSDWTP